MLSRSSLQLSALTSLSTGCYPLPGDMNDRLYYALAGGILIEGKEWNS